MSQVAELIEPQHKSLTKKAGHRDRGSNPRGDANGNKKSLNHLAVIGAFFCARVLANSSRALLPIAAPTKELRIRAVSGPPAHMCFPVIYLTFFKSHPVLAPWIVIWIWATDLTASRVALIPEFLLHPQVERPATRLPFGKNGFQQ